MTRPRWSEAEVSRFPLLFALVGILIVSTIVAFVLVEDGSDSSDKQAGKTLAASSAVPSSAASSPASTPSVSAGSSSNAAHSGRSATSGTPGGAQPTTRITPTATPSTSSAKPAPKITAPPYRTITYTVKEGDNLTVIAAWFKLHGYGDLYERNRAVIGDDPDLIFPGQQITISSRGMTVSD